jgi:lipopolysaccharide heptosyltransferase II
MRIFVTISRKADWLYNGRMPGTPMSARPPLKRILAVKLADLGDLLTITPALQALKAAHPPAEIDLLVPPGSVQLLQGSPFLHRIIAFDKFPFDTLAGLMDVRRVARTLRFLTSLRLARYDAIVLFHHFTLRWGSIKFAVLCYVSGTRVRAGLDNGRGRFLTVKAPDLGFGAKHEADYWLSVAGLLGADAWAGWKPYIPIDARSDENVANLLTNWGRKRANPAPLVAIHPGAGAYSLARIWPVRRFAEVARGLIDSCGASVVIVGGPDEVSIAAELERLADRGEQVLNVAGKTAVHESAALIRRCDLFVGNDSGPMHIAAAVGTPVVAIFGPSNQQVWGPYTPPGEVSRHRIVARDLPCMPCFYRVHSLGLREGCGPRPCLTGLRAEAVLQACREGLGIGGW